MKPTITNAFNDDAPEVDGAAGGEHWTFKRPSAKPTRPDPRKSLAGSLAAMQADLREASFGFSLELSPMQAIDALNSLTRIREGAPAIAYLVNIEQSAWRDADRSLTIGEIVQRLALPVTAEISADQLVLDESSLRQLVSLCQPSRLVVIAVEGEIDERDARAMSKAIDADQSPLTAELRAIAAMEVLGDRSIVLHARDKNLALEMVADNFRHYLSALSNSPVARFQPPELWQLDRLFSNTGQLTVRPIETQQFTTSYDVGINTTKQRFSRPADRSLIYDIPSNTWHDEP